MTVSTELSHEEYVGNGVTTDFDFRFRIFEGKHLIVVVADSDGNETTLKNGTDYTIVGAGSYHGGKVVLNKPLAQGWKILLERDLPVVQETDLRNQGKFFAEVHEDAFDYLTMLIQKALGTFSLSLRKPTYLSNYYDAKGNRIANLAPPKLGTDSANKDYVDNSIKDIDSKTLRVKDKDIPALPNADDRAGKVLTFDKDGYPIAVAPASGSAIDVLNQLSLNSGSSLIGTESGNNIQEELNNLKLGQVKITDFGAIAGQDCSDAFELAFKTGKTVIVPDTSYDKPWIITRNIQLPLVAKIIGNSPAFPFGYKERFEFNGPYIQFKGGSFICGDGVISRVFLYCKNLMLMGRYGADINDKSILDNAGVAFNGTAGGYLDNISFAGLQYAMINDYSYFLNMSNIRANNNYWVFKLNDFNSSSIENYFGSYNTIHIDLGEDAARSSLRNIGINMNTGTKVGVRFEGGVSLDGYIYFENFGTPASGSVCLAVNFGRYSQRSINISNVLFHANLCDYAMTIGATTNNNVRISGKFDCCDWYEPKIAKIGFGVTPRFNGEPTYPTAVIKDINFDTHAGLSLSDIQKPSNSPYRKWVQSPFGSWRETKNIDISGPSYKNIQLSSDNLVDSNVLFDYDEGKIIIPNDGVYNISLSATLSNVKSEYHRGARIDILLNGAIISSSLTSVNRPDSDASYSNISVSVSIYISIGSLIYIRGKDGDKIYGINFSINKIN